MKKVAVILSGCGVFDGAEIYETVITLLAIRHEGAQYHCFAPDKEQLHVVNHLTGDVEESQQRNVLVEAARVVRGDIRPVTECDVAEYDALILPGGFGAAKNLCTFATEGAECHADDDVLAVCKAFAKARKPTGYACIAPALAACVYGDGVKLTIGHDKDTANAINQLGASHVDCEVDDIVIDTDAKLVTTPAYMLAGDILEAQTGLNKMVQTVLAMK